MTWIIWFILWIVAALPLGKLLIRKELSCTIMKGVIIFTIGITLILLNLSDMIMLWWWLIFLLVSIALDLLSGGHKGGAAVGVIVVIVGVVGIFVFCTAGVNNAIYFDHLITKSTDFPIENITPDNMVRLTTEDFVNRIVQNHMAQFGSAAVNSKPHLTIYNSSLYWVSTITKHEDWGLQRKALAMILVNANSPDDPVIVINEEFQYVEGLDFNVFLSAHGDAKARGYYGIGTENQYGDAYPVVDSSDKWSIALTSYHPNAGFVWEYNGVYQLDKQGNIINHFIDQVPSYMAKPYDEEFLERGIKDRGGYNRGGSYDFWAGGFFWISPSNDRTDISEDTRVVYDPDTKQPVAMVMVHPIRENGGRLSLAGTYVADSKGIRYHDLSTFNLMSGNAASGIVQSKITARSGTTLTTAGELLYPICRINNQTIYGWVVPIYYNNPNGQIGLAGVGIVNAQSANDVIIKYTENGVSGMLLYKEARESFESLYKGSGFIKTTTNSSINVTMVAKYEPYVTNGNTRQWIIVSIGQDKVPCLIKNEEISDQEMLKIQQLKEQDKFTITIDDNNIIKNINFLGLSCDGLYCFLKNKK